MNYGMKDNLHIKFIHKISLEIKCFKEQYDNIDILICTPLKFVKLFKKSDINISTIQFIVFDEADKYFELVLTFIYSVFI